MIKKELSNIEICKSVCEILDKDPDRNLEYVTDRLGHDFRYSITDDKIKKLGFQSNIQFKDALRETVLKLWEEA